MLIRRLISCVGTHITVVIIHKSDSLSTGSSSGMEDTLNTFFFEALKLLRLSDYQSNHDFSCPLVPILLGSCELFMQYDCLHWE